MVHSYLRTMRILRTWGALGWLLVVRVVVPALGFNARSLFWLWMFLRYLAGTLYTESSRMPRTADDGPGRACNDPLR